VASRNGLLGVFREYTIQRSFQWPETLSYCSLRLPSWLVWLLCRFGPRGMPSWRGAIFEPSGKEFLYRSGQMTLDGLARSIHDHGIRSVVTFRASNRPGKPDPDAGEEAWCKQEGIRYLRLPPLHWQGEDSASPPVEENLKKYLQFPFGCLQLSNPDPLFCRHSQDWGLLRCL